MEILHFEDLGDTECRLAANAVVLVLGEYKSNFNSNVPQGCIYPRTKFERDQSNICLWVDAAAAMLKPKYHRTLRSVI